MVPEGWKAATLGDLASLQRGYDLPAQARTKGCIPVIGAGGVNGTHESANVKGPGVVLGRCGAGAGTAHYIGTDFWAHNTSLFVTDFKGNDTKYVFYALGNMDFSVFMAGGAQPSLNRNFIYPIPMAIPPLSEQKKIVAILDSWGVADHTTRGLIKSRQGLKHGLLQHLITGRRRFPEFAKERRRERSLGEFLSESRIRGADGATARKLTIKLYGRGVVPKSEKIVGSAATQYFLRKSGQFIYSKLDFLNGAFCVVPDALDGYETTADLPAFDVEGSLNPRWLLAYVCRESFYRRKLGLAAGGRKARRVNPDAFLRIKISVPSRAEQDKIVEFLDAIDREIDLLTRQADALIRQKKALMQKLLTGQIRVKV